VVEMPYEGSGGWEMIELLKLIFDKIDLSKVILAARDARKAGLASDLFLVVVYTNDIVITAKQIFSALESVCILQGGTKDSARGRAARLLREQYFNLHKLDQMLTRLRTEMNVVDPNLFRKLSELRYGKFNLIKEVETLCQGGNFVMLDDFSRVLPKYAHRVENLFDDLLGFEKQRYLEETSINLDRELNDAEIAKIKSYLKHRNPKQMIEDLALTVDGFQRKLSEHFTLSDVLLNIQSKK
jgi:hypothetical protein